MGARAEAQSGEVINVRVLAVDAARGRIQLSMRDVE
jgi:ribosomal protein S1